MPLFQPEILEAVDQLRRGTSVEVVATHGMGRTTFARRVVEVLGRSGIQVLELAGARHGRQAPFSAIRESGVVVARDRVGVYPLATALAQDLLHDGAAVVVLDDAVDIDEESLAVVGLTQRRVGFPVLATGTPHHGGAVPARQWFPTGDSVRIALGPLTYEQTSEIVHEDLDGPVDSRVIARVHAKSSGITGLVGAIVRSAVQSRGLVVSEGLWRMAAPSLWNEHLVTVAEQILAGLEDRDYQTAYELGLLGTASLDQLTASGRLDAVARLEERGLISLTGRESSEALVTLHPLLVVDYFRNRLPEVRGVMLAHGLADSLGIPVADLLVVPDPTAAEGSTGAARGPVAEGRGHRVPSHPLADRHALGRPGCAAAWAADPTPAHALAYLPTVWEQEDEPGVVQRIFDRSDRTIAGTSKSELLAYTFAKVHWHAFVRRDARGVARALRWLVGLSAEYAPDAEGMALFARVVGTRVRPADVERARALVAARPGSWTTRFALLAALAVQGAGEEALAVDRPPGDVPAQVDSYWESFRALALVGLDRFDEALDMVLARLEESRRTHDRPGAYLFTFAAAHCLFRTGGWERATSLLSETFALGGPGVATFPIYRALQRMGALLTFLTGHRSVADSLLVESQGGPDGPMAWMQQEVGDAIRALMDGDAASAAGYAVRGAERGRACGYEAMARVEYLFAVWVDPTREHLDALDDICEDRTTAMRPGRHLSFRRYVRRVLDDPDGVVGYASDYASSKDLLLGLQVSRRLAERAQEARPRRLLEEAAGILADRLGRESQVLRSGDLAVRSLTERELQIARLAANRTNAEIASDLHLSRRTVENHIYRALKKTGSPARDELAELAIAASDEGWAGIRLRQGA